MTSPSQPAKAMVTRDKRAVKTSFTEDLRIGKVIDYSTTGHRFICYRIMGVVEKDPTVV